MTECRSPKVLVLSINAFSCNGSNGRVLSELFDGWDEDSLAQFYIYNELPNFNVCKNYFRITDKEAMKSLLTLKKYGRNVQNLTTEDYNVLSEKKPKKSPLTYLCRDLVWRSGFWKSKKFWSWIKEFSPDCILLQADNSSFMPKLALKISKKYDIPIIVFNTENYYFKRHDYISRKKFSIAYFILRKLQNRAFRRLMKRSNAEIYNSEKLRKMYELEFGKPGSVIYQSTNLKTFCPKTTDEVYKFLYAGNLGLGRHNSLIEIANILQFISDDYILDVYGSATEEVVEQLNAVKGIVYHGVKPYDVILKAMEKSDFLCHAESFDEWSVNDLTTAFSTKITDYLASGRCVIVYSDESLACTQYLLENNCACIITKSDELYTKLYELINCKSMQDEYIKKAVEIANNYHNSKINSKLLKQTICDTIRNYKNAKCKR